MTIGFCNRCNGVYTVAPMVSDFVHNCSSQSGTSPLAYEDVPIVDGNFTDADNTTGSIEGNAQYANGQANDLQGTRGGHEGARSVDRTPRGANADTTRARPYFQYIDNLGKL